MRNYFIKVCLVALSFSIVGCKSYYYVQAANVNLRESPELTSHVITMLNKSDKVQFLKDTAISVETKTDNGSILKANMFKIKTHDGSEGYIFSGYLSKTNEIEYDYNDDNFDIVGEWPAYYDTPNFVYTFYSDGKITEETSSFDTSHNKTVNGKYKYDGKCSINYAFEDGTSGLLEVVIVKKRKTLKSKAFFFDPELFKKK
jgi:hypothetical protein